MGCLIAPGSLFIYSGSKARKIALSSTKKLFREAPNCPLCLTRNFELEFAPLIFI